MQFTLSCNPCICEVSCCIVSWLLVSIFCTENLSTRNSWALFNSPISWILLIWISRNVFFSRSASFLCSRGLLSSGFFIPTIYTDWKCLDFLALGFPKGSVEVLSSAKFSLNSCSQSGNSCDISLCTSLRSSFFIFVFGFCGFMQRVSPKLSTRTSTSFWYWIFGVSLDIKYGILWWRCWKSRCGVLLRNSYHKWYKVRYIAINPFVSPDEMWFLTAGPVVSIPMILAWLSERKDCGCFFKKHKCHE